MGLFKTLFDKAKAKLENVNNGIVSSNPIELLEQSIKQHEVDLAEKEQKFSVFKGKIKGQERELEEKKARRDEIQKRLAVCERRGDQEGLSQGRDLFNEVSKEIETLQSSIDSTSSTVKEIEEILDQKRNYIKQLKNEKTHLATQYELAKAKNDLMNFKKEFENGSNSSNPYVKNAYELIDRVNAMDSSSNKKTHDLFKDL